MCVCVCVCVCVCIWSAPLLASVSPSARWGACPLSDALTLAPQVTSALQPLHPSVHHLQSASGDPSTTVSQLLLGLPWPVPVANVSATLDSIVQRVYEVIDIRVRGAAFPLLGGRGGGRGCRDDSPAGGGWSDLRSAHPGPNRV